MKTGQQKKGMGLWLLIQGGLFTTALIVGKGMTAHGGVLAYGFVISFFLIFLNKRVMNQLKQGEFNEVQNKVEDYSIAFTFLLMFFLVSPFFKMLGNQAGWALTLALLGTDYLILSLLHGKAMLWLGGLTLLDALLLMLIRSLPVSCYLGVYTFLLLGFGILLFFVKERKEA